MKNRQNVKGFTLLETMIAMMIMAAAILLLANSWSGAFMRVKKTQLSFEISSLLERKMVEIETKYRGKPLDEISEEEEGDFGEDYPQYAWKLSSKKLEFPDLSASLIAREGGADQMLTNIIHQLSEQISKSVKEVTVTVIYKQPKKNLEYSLTTYFVDYDKELNLGMPGS